MQTKKKIMKPSRRNPAPIQEQIMLDYVERLGRFREGRRAAHVHLSRLQPFNRRQQHLRIAATTMQPVVQRFEGIVFELFNDDLVMICKGATVSEMDEAVLRLRFLFSDDPLLSSEEEDNEGFCTWYDLEEDYADVLALAAHYDRGRVEYDKAVQKAETENGEELPVEPLDPPHLAIIEKSIAQADLSSMIARQMIYQMVGKSSPQQVFEEIYISIDSLRETLMPNFDITANRWLFQDLTRHLDMRMLAILLHSDDCSLRQSFSLNLNISTVLSPQFLKFDATLTDSQRNSIVVELQLIDIFGDLGNFYFARDFLRDRGFRLCLDGLTHLSLPFVDRAQFGLDLCKLHWSPELSQQLSSTNAMTLRNAVQKLGAERTVLSRCEEPESIELGQSLGIALFQGYYLDRLHNSNRTSTDVARTLSQAMTRQRLHARSTGRFS